MKFVIEGKEFSKDQLSDWKRKRIKKVIKNLKGNIPEIADVEKYNDKLTELKLQLGYEKINERLKTKLFLSNIGMNLAAKLSGKRRKFSIATIYAKGIDVAKLSKLIDMLMLENSQQFYKVNLAACPDHYALTTRDGILEVIETTGNVPVPTKFYITFNEETNLQTPRLEEYPFQSVGVAKLKDGTVVGGVRHQFRNVEDGIEARMCVEFPALCPTMFVKEHQIHLLCEWSNWIQWAIDNQDKY